MPAQRFYFHRNFFAREKVEKFHSHTCKEIRDEGFDAGETHEKNGKINGGVGYFF